MRTAPPKKKIKLSFLTVSHIYVTCLSSGRQTCNTNPPIMLTDKAALSPAQTWRIAAELYSPPGCGYFIYTRTHTCKHVRSCSVTVQQAASWQQIGSHLQGISRFHCRPSNANTKNNCHIQTGAEMTGWVSIHLVCPGLSFLFAAMKSWNRLRTQRRREKIKCVRI